MDPSEFITIGTFEELCKGRPGLHYCTTGEVHRFFEECYAGGVDENVVLVTSQCDYGIRLQDSQHPNLDVHKHFYALNFDAICAERGSYVRAELGPTVDGNYCHPDDRYSVKIDRFTKSTFSSLPKNVVRWYSTNLDINHPNIEWIPYGLNNHGHGLKILPDFRGRPKKGLLYVNFQINSVERIRLREHYRSVPWVTFRDSANLPVEQYLAELAEHCFVLSPEGNGLDCYRNYEAIYLDTVPILQNSVMSRKMLECGLPLLAASNLFGLSEAQLRELWDTNLFDGTLEPVTKSYWAKKLADARRPTTCIHGC